MQLAIETIGRRGSVAIGPSRLNVLSIAQREALLATASCQLPEEQRAARSLIPEIQRLMGEMGVTIDAIRQISIASGPGSFTGLRIGVTTAKTLGFAWKVPVIAVDSVASIAAAAFCAKADAQRIAVGIDAFRGQVFCGIFDRQMLLPDWELSVSQGQEADTPWTAFPKEVISLPKEKFLAEIAKQPDTTSWCGEAKVFAAAGKDPAEIIGDPKWIATIDIAVGVAVLADQAARRSLVSDPMTLVPHYLKLSAAEEKLSS